MIKIKTVLIFLVSGLFLLPSPALALQIEDFVFFANQNNIFSANAYLVLDTRTGNILAEKQAGVSWPPASLAKLMTAMVVIDINPTLKKTISIKKQDEVGGARIPATVGVSYKIKDLFYAALIGSANNATNALARSTGVSQAQFLAKMNAKAQQLGAKNTVFVDPSGISEKNRTTAEDYAKIAKAAFEYMEITQATGLKEYFFSSTNNKRYKHTVKNTNKLLGDSDFGPVLGKTGYLTESQYNFAGKILDKTGNEYILVLLGADSSTLQFQEVKQLAFLVGLNKVFSFAANNLFGKN